ncbi:MAG: Y-family DNA polymerase [Rikenellaceae bacterium]
MFGLCDCNNFYASCQRVFDPSLEGRPLIVLSGNDGCVIARSNEAKALGIKMGQPFFQIRQIVRQHKVAIFSSNFELYGDMSARVMQTLRSMVEEVEVYSIDEAFLWFDEDFSHEQLKDYGHRISDTVRRHTGIPVSLGISHTKTLAKVASRLCKLYPRLQGCCVMVRDQDIAKVLEWFPISDVWGVGRKSVTKLREVGVTTAAQFCQLSPEWIRSALSVTGLRTWKELHGESCIEFDEIPSSRQSIMVSRSFSHEIYDLDEMIQAVTSFATSASVKLRREGSVASMMQVFIHTNGHRADAYQYSESESIRFPTPTDSTLEIVKYAIDVLRRIYLEDFGYKKAGVLLYDLSSNLGIQSSLFDNVDRLAHRALMRQVDMLNDELGRGSVRLASEGDGVLSVRGEHLSPRYTTSWDDILIVKN